MEGGDSSIQTVQWNYSQDRTLGNIVYLNKKIIFKSSKKCVNATHLPPVNMTVNVLVLYME